MDAHHAGAVLAEHGVVGGHGGRRVGAHVGEDEADVLLDLVGRLLDGAHDGFVLLGGRFEDVAVAVVEPTVVCAGDAALLDASVDEGGGAVGAVVGEESYAVGLVLEEDEVFGEDAEGLGRLLVGEVRGDGDGVPVAA